MYPVLIVDDEKPIADLIEMTLQKQGYECVKAHSGEAAADQIEANRFDLILLDVMLPDIDGFSLMSYIEPTKTPVIFISAKDAVADRVQGLTLGAYDYIVKPFAPEELLARVDGLMRHTGRRSSVIEINGVIIDTEAHTAKTPYGQVELTPREYDLLMALLQNKGIALYRDILFERVWGIDSEANIRTLDIHISRLRKKLAWEGVIKTVSKIGYMLEENQ